MKFIALSALIEMILYQVHQRFLKLFKGFQVRVLWDLFEGVFEQFGKFWSDFEVFDVATILGVFRSILGTFNQL